MNDNEGLKFDPNLYGRVVCAALLHNDCIYMGVKDIMLYFLWNLLEF